MTTTDLAAHRTKADRRRQLTMLDVPETVVVESVRRGWLDSLSCSPLDPPMLEGVMRWARTMRYLREQLVPNGWKAADDDNFSVCIHPSQKFFIAAATGNDETGLTSGIPQTRHPKGSITDEHVRANNRQLTFFPVGDTDLSKVPFWLLLIAKNVTELRFELSLPAGVAPSGRITSWVTRIIFDPIPIKAPTPVVPGPAGEGRLHRPVVTPRS